MLSNRKFKFQVLPVYLVCVAFATLLWLLTMLSKNYTTEISMPVQFVDFPQDKIANSELPTSINVVVHGRGFNLTKLQTSVKNSAITFSIKELMQSHRGNHININVQELRERVGTQINPSLSVNAVHPETINFTLAEVAHKSVPVKINSDITFKKQYTQKGVTSATPAMVTITGPQQAIDTIKYVTTQRVVKHDIYSNVTEDIKLLPIPNVTFSTESITLNIEAEQTTGAERSVAINVINLPSNIKMTLFPERAQLTYEVGLSRYEESLKDNFRVVVDYNATKQGNDFLEISPIVKPAYIENLNISPKRVEYIIE